MKTLALCLFVFVFGRLSEQFSISTQIVVDQQETPTRLDGRDNWDSATLRFAFEIHADLCYANKGQFTIGALKDHIKGIRPDNKQKRILRIVSINTTNIAAQAANAIEYPKRLLADYINLIPIVSWKILRSTVFENSEHTCKAGLSKLCIN
jgi:hypothetical protein